MSYYINIKTINMYICTSSDSHYYPKLLSFIGSLHKVNFDEIKEIAVFNLGLTKKQINDLKKIEKVAIYDIEITHPDLLTYFYTRPGPSNPRRGWYAWKPVAIKQALDMFPHMLYADAGIIFLNPINNLYLHIKQNGYVFFTCSTNIKRMCTRYVIDKFNLNSDDRKWILDEKTHGLSAGFMGLSHKYYNNFVLPMYNLSYDINNFVDDGTAPNGFGNARHDQPLFSIHARLLNLEIKPWLNTNLFIDGKKINFNLYNGKDPFCGIIYLWARFNKWKHMQKYIKYKSQ